MAQIIVVDNFIIVARPDFYNELKSNMQIMQSRFDFGKWKENEAEFAGRHIKCHPVDQSKYI